MIDQMVDQKDMIIVDEFFEIKDVIIIKGGVVIRRRVLHERGCYTKKNNTIYATIITTRK